MSIAPRTAALAHPQGWRVDSEMLRLISAERLLALFGGIAAVLALITSASAPQ